MTDKESVQPAMDKSDTPTHSVDYYYLEAMRYLSCENHHSDDSDSEHHCSCRECQNEQGANDTCSIGNSHHCNDDDMVTGRERSWSHSMAEDRETISQLPNLDGKVVGGRLKTRRFSDGMLLKPNMKVTNGRVHWADDCKKELTRCRPRKTYTRNPTHRQAPMKSILKNSSEESLVIQEDGSTDDSDQG